MGHYSAGFTLDTYGHLMDALPKRQVEWIDELVFPEGWQAALKLHLYCAPQGAVGCSPMPSGKAVDPLENVAPRITVQSDVAGLRGGGREIRTPEGSPPSGFQVRSPR